MLRLVLLFITYLKTTFNINFLSYASHNLDFLLIGLWKRDFLMFSINDSVLSLIYLDPLNGVSFPKVPFLYWTQHICCYTLFFAHIKEQWMFTVLRQICIEIAGNDSAEWKCFTGYTFGCCLQLHILSNKYCAVAVIRKALGEPWEELFIRPHSTFVNHF